MLLRKLYYGFVASLSAGDHLFAASGESAADTARRSLADSRPARRGRRPHSVAGFTLLEVMIATAVTLLMMLALAQIFKVIGDSMKQGRAVLELNNRLRSVVYRLRTDLDHLTALPQPPTDPATATGYLQIFDGSLTDYSTAQISLAHSRFGDVDDILMATVRAGDVWFTGKVPAYVLAGVNPSSTADLQLVSIASQHAEIAVFAQPTGGLLDPTTSAMLPYDLNDPLRLPTRDGVGNFKDVDLLSDFPDSFRLHYRALLIRPDLNLSTTGALPGGVVNSINWTVCSPVIGLPSPLCDMARTHQQCDLSIRRVYNTGTNTYDLVAANSLEDLMDPANRFAHVQVPIPGTRSTTMPLLALSRRLNAPPQLSNDPSGTLGGNNFEVGSGFLHPAFVLSAERTGEDLLGSDILAFDIKVFDPGVPLLGSVGPDGQVGDATNNEFGWAGSDDLVLSPNDPGYAAALASNPVRVIGSGEYVDLAWARKLAAGGATLASGMNLWSPFSGYSQPNFTANGAMNGFTDGLYLSGYVVRSSNSALPLVLQPSYDTWTSRYEGDGVLQAQLNGGAGVVRIDGSIALYGLGNGSDVGNVTPAWRVLNGVPVIDAATDGIDNNPAVGLGVDDASERETSPPYPTPLRGLKISVRMEDPLSRQVKQMSAAKEFVTQ